MLSNLPMSFGVIHRLSPSQNFGSVVSGVPPFIISQTSPSVFIPQLCFISAPELSLGSQRFLHPVLSFLQVFDGVGVKRLLLSCWDFWQKDRRLFYQFSSYQCSMSFHFQQRSFVVQQ